MFANDASKTAREHALSERPRAACGVVSGGTYHPAANVAVEGAACFDATGAARTQAKDRCSKRLKSGCIKRYGSKPLPFGGFPGVGRGSTT